MSPSGGDGQPDTGQRTPPVKEGVEEGFGGGGGGGGFCGIGLQGLMIFFFLLLLL